MTAKTLTKDFMNRDIEIDARFFVMIGTEAMGWIETRGPDVAAFKADGGFINWFRTRREALSAIGC